MKLRNKKTGEIVEPRKIGFEIYSFNEREFNSIAEFNEEWEDAPEEPKPYWYIDFDGEIDCDNNIDLNRTDSIIGNYFSSKEEAEKAVEKLKAWKRLRDKGLKITGYGKYAYDPKSSHHIGIKLDYAPSDEVKKDLDLLFGGEE